MDALEKSNTKLTEEVSVMENHWMLWSKGINHGGRGSFQICGIQNEGCLMMDWNS